MHPSGLPHAHPAINPAVIDDAPDLAALAALTFPLACPPTLTHTDIAAFIEAELQPSHFRTYILTPGTQVLLARDSAADPVGYILAISGRGTDRQASAGVRGTHPLYLSKCYTAPRTHGTGLAQRLLSFLVDVSLACGHDSLWLGTNNDNMRARRFYEKSGFTIIGTRDFVVGGQTCRDVVYERMLTP